jgi:hypothetical protein
MTNIQEATAIVLTDEERAELNTLARSTRTEFRLRRRAQIVLLAADGDAGSLSPGRGMCVNGGLVESFKIPITGVWPFDKTGCGRTAVCRAHEFSMGQKGHQIADCVEMLLPLRPICDEVLGFLRCHDVLSRGALNMGRQRTMSA